MKCQLCSIEFTPKVGSTGKFCTKSCSAKFNNRLRTHSEKTRKAISSKLSSPRGPKTTGSCRIQFKDCKICQRKFCVSISSPRITCSKTCQVTASTKMRTYQNGSRKPIYYTKADTNEIVMLESSWELRVAIRLDELQIKWARPDPIPWKDSSGRSRLYFPDFYLSDLDTYLDPKNPYCMKLDEEKMRIISSQVHLIFGPIEHILNFIEKQSS